MCFLETELASFELENKEDHYMKVTLGEELSQLGHRKSIHSLHITSDFSSVGHVYLKQHIGVVVYVYVILAPLD